MDLVDRTRFLDQIPYRRSNGIETVIRAAAQVKDDCVSVQGTGNLVLYSRYSPSLGARTAHLTTPLLVGWQNRANSEASNLTTPNGAFRAFTPFACSFR